MAGGRKFNATYAYGIGVAIDKEYDKVLGRLSEDLKGIDKQANATKKSLQKMMDDPAKMDAGNVAQVKAQFLDLLNTVEDFGQVRKLLTGEYNLKEMFNGLDETKKGLIELKTQIDNLDFDGITKQLSTMYDMIDKIPSNMQNKLTSLFMTSDKTAKRVLKSGADEILALMDQLKNPTDGVDTSALKKRLLSSMSVFSEAWKQASKIPGLDLNNIVDDRHFAGSVKQMMSRLSAELGSDEMFSEINKSMDKFFGSFADRYNKIHTNGMFKGIVTDSKNAVSQANKAAQASERVAVKLKAILGVVNQVSNTDIVSKEQIGSLQKLLDLIQDVDSVKVDTDVDTAIERFDELDDIVANITGGKKITPEFLNTLKFEDIDTLGNSLKEMIAIGRKYKDELNLDMSIDVEDADSDVKSALGTYEDDLQTIINTIKGQLSSLNDEVAKATSELKSKLSDLGLKDIEISLKLPDETAFTEYVNSLNGFIDRLNKGGLKEIELPMPKFKQNITLTKDEKDILGEQSENIYKSLDEFLDSYLGAVDDASQVKIKKDAANSIIQKIIGDNGSFDKYIINLKAQFAKVKEVINEQKKTLEKNITFDFKWKNINAENQASMLFQELQEAFVNKDLQIGIDIADLASQISEAFSKAGVQVNLTGAANVSSMPLDTSQLASALAMSMREVFYGTTEKKVSSTPDRTPVNVSVEVTREKYVSNLKELINSYSDGITDGFENILDGITNAVEKTAKYATHIDGGEKRDAVKKFFASTGLDLESISALNSRDKVMEWLQNYILKADNANIAMGADIIDRIKGSKFKDLKTIADPSNAGSLVNTLGRLFNVLQIANHDAQEFSNNNNNIDVIKDIGNRNRALISRRKVLDKLNPENMTATTSDIELQIDVIKKIQDFKKNFKNEKWMPELDRMINIYQELLGIFNGTTSFENEEAKVDKIRELRDSLESIRVGDNRNLIRSFSGSIQVNTKDHRGVARKGDEIAFSGQSSKNIERVLSAIERTEENGNEIIIRFDNTANNTAFGGFYPIETTKADGTKEIVYTRQSRGRERQMMRGTEKPSNVSQVTRKKDLAHQEIDFVPYKKREADSSFKYGDSVDEAYWADKKKRLEASKASTEEEISKQQQVIGALEKEKETIESNVKKIEKKYQTMNPYDTSIDYDQGILSGDDFAIAKMKAGKSGYTQNLLNTITGYSKNYDFDVKSDSGLNVFNQSLVEFLSSNKDIISELDRYRSLLADVQKLSTEIDSLKLGSSNDEATISAKEEELTKKKDVLKGLKEKREENVKKILDSASKSGLQFGSVDEILNVNSSAEKIMNKDIELMKAYFTSMSSSPIMKFFKENAKLIDSFEQDRTDKDKALKLVESVNRAGLKFGSLDDIVLLNNAYKRIEVGIKHQQDLLSVLNLSDENIENEINRLNKIPEDKRSKSANQRVALLQNLLANRKNGTTQEADIYKDVRSAGKGTNDILGDFASLLTKSESKLNVDEYSGIEPILENIIGQFREKHDQITNNIIDLLGKRATDTNKEKLQYALDALESLDNEYDNFVSQVTKINPNSRIPKDLSFVTDNEMSKQAIEKFNIDNQRQALNEQRKALQKEYDEIIPMSNGDKALLSFEQMIQDFLDARREYDKIVSDKTQVKNKDQRLKRKQKVLELRKIKETKHNEIQEFFDQTFTQPIENQSRLIDEYLDITEKQLPQKRDESLHVKQGSKAFSIIEAQARSLEKRRDEILEEIQSSSINGISADTIDSLRKAQRELNAESSKDTATEATIKPLRDKVNAIKQEIINSMFSKFGLEMHQYVQDALNTILGNNQNGVVFIRSRWSIEKLLGADKRKNTIAEQIKAIDEQLVTIDAAESALSQSDIISRVYERVRSSRKKASVGTQLRDADTAKKDIDRKILDEQDTLYNLRNAAKSQQYEIDKIEYEKEYNELLIHERDLISEIRDMKANDQDPNEVIKKQQELASLKERKDELGKYIVSQDYYDMVQEHNVLEQVTNERISALTEYKSILDTEKQLSDEIQSLKANANVDAKLLANKEAELASVRENKSIKAKEIVDNNLYDNGRYNESYEERISRLLDTVTSKSIDAKVKNLSEQLEQSKNEVTIKGNSLTDKKGKIIGLKIRNVEEEELSVKTESLKAAVEYQELLNQAHRKISFYESEIQDIKEEAASLKKFGLNSSVGKRATNEFKNNAVNEYRRSDAFRNSMNAIEDQQFGQKAEELIQLLQNNEKYKHLYDETFSQFQHILNTSNDDVSVLYRQGNLSIEELQSMFYDYMRKHITNSLKSGSYKIDDDGNLTKFTSEFKSELQEARDAASEAIKRQEEQLIFDYKNSIKIENGKATYKSYSYDHNGEEITEDLIASLEKIREYQQETYKAEIKKLQALVPNIEKSRDSALKDGGLAGIDLKNADISQEIFKINAEIARKQSEQENILSQINAEESKGDAASKEKLKGLYSQNKELDKQLDNLNQQVDDYELLAKVRQENRQLNKQTDEEKRASLVETVARQEQAVTNNKKAQETIQQNINKLKKDGASKDEIDSQKAYLYETKQRGIKLENRLAKSRERLGAVEQRISESPTVVEGQQGGIMEPVVQLLQNIYALLSSGIKINGSVSIDGDTQQGSTGTNSKKERKKGENYERNRNLAIYAKEKFGKVPQKEEWKKLVNQYASGKLTDFDEVLAIAASKAATKPVKSSDKVAKEAGKKVGKQAAKEVKKSIEDGAKSGADKQNKTTKEENSKLSKYFAKKNGRSATKEEWKKLKEDYLSGRLEDIDEVLSKEDKKGGTANKQTTKSKSKTKQKNNGSKQKETSIAGLEEKIKNITDSVVNADGVDVDALLEAKAQIAEMRAEIVEIKARESKQQSKANTKKQEGKSKKTTYANGEYSSYDKLTEAIKQKAKEYVVSSNDLSKFDTFKDVSESKKAENMAAKVKLYLENAQNLYKELESWSGDKNIDYYAKRTALGQSLSAARNFEKKLNPDKNFNKNENWYEYLSSSYGLKNVEQLLLTPTKLKGNKEVIDAFKDQKEIDVPSVSTEPAKESASKVADKVIKTGAKAADESVEATPTPDVNTSPVVSATEKVAEDIVESGLQSVEESVKQTEEPKADVQQIKDASNEVVDTVIEDVANSIAESAENVQNEANKIDVKKSIEEASEKYSVQDKNVKVSDIKRMTPRMMKQSLGSYMAHAQELYKELESWSGDKGLEYYAKRMALNNTLETARGLEGKLNPKKHYNKDKNWYEYLSSKYNMPKAKSLGITSSMIDGNQDIIGSLLTDSVETVAEETVHSGAKSAVTAAKEAPSPEVSTTTITEAAQNVANEVVDNAVESIVETQSHRTEPTNSPREKLKMPDALRDISSTGSLNTRLSRFNKEASRVDKQFAIDTDEDKTSFSYYSEDGLNAFVEYISAMKEFKNLLATLPKDDDGKTIITEETLNRLNDALEKTKLLRTEAYKLSERDNGRLFEAENAQVVTNMNTGDMRSRRETMEQFAKNYAQSNNSEFLFGKYNYLNDSITFDMVDAYGHLTKTTLAWRQELDSAIITQQQFQYAIDKTTQDLLIQNNAINAAVEEGFLNEDYGSDDGALSKYFELCDQYKAKQQEIENIDMSAAGSTEKYIQAQKDLVKIREELTKQGDSLLAQQKSAYGFNKASDVFGNSSNMLGIIGNVKDADNIPLIQNYKNALEALQKEYNDLFINGQLWNNDNGQQDRLKLLADTAKVAEVALQKAYEEFLKLDNATIFDEEKTNKIFDGVDMANVEEIGKAMRKYANSIEGVIPDSISFNAETKTLSYSIRTASNEVQDMTLQMYGYNHSLGESIKGTRQVQTGMEKFIGSLKGKFQELARYLLSFGSIYEVFNIVRQGVTYVREVDAALTELRKVTDETDASYSKFLKNMANSAGAIGTTVKDLTASAADWARLGYSLEDAGDLAKNTSILMNVSEFDDISHATDTLISTLQAYKNEAVDVGDYSMQIIDKFNEVGNNYAISTSDLAESLTRSSSALVAAGNTLEESIALTTAANTIIQDPESVGNALKVVSMRIRGVKTE